MWPRRPGIHRRTEGGRRRGAERNPGDERRERLRERHHGLPRGLHAGRLGPGRRRSRRRLRENGARGPSDAQDPGREVRCPAAEAGAEQEAPAALPQPLRGPVSGAQPALRNHRGADGEGRCEEPPSRRPQPARPVPGRGHGAAGAGGARDRRSADPADVLPHRLGLGRGPALQRGRRPSGRG